MPSDQGSCPQEGDPRADGRERGSLSVAARKLDASPPARDTAVRDVIARANATLAAPSARFEYRRETDVPVRERREQPRPGPVGRLVRRAARSLRGRLSPAVDAAQLGEMFRQAFLHLSGEGFLEPAADRYHVDYGAYTQMYFDGQLRGGPPCRTVDIRAGAAALTVWIDDEHVRQIRPEYRGRGGARRSPLRVGCLKGRTFAATLEPRMRRHARPARPSSHGRENRRVVGIPERFSIMYPHDYSS